MSINVVTMIGNLTKKPELRQINADTKKAQFTIAINEGKDKTLFVNCVAFNKTAEVLDKYTDKGNKIGLTGRYARNDYEKDGKPISFYYVLVNQIELLSSKKEEVQSEPRRKNTRHDIYEDDKDSIPFN